MHLDDTGAPISELSQREFGQEKMGGLNVAIIPWAEFFLFDCSQSTLISSVHRVGLFVSYKLGLPVHLSPLFLGYCVYSVQKSVHFAELSHFAEPNDELLWR